MTVAMAEKGAGWEAETLGGGMGRKEKRKALKKQKRKQTRKEVAAKEREEEEAKANDPEEQLKVRLREQEEAEIAERERKAFEEHERLWLEAASRRAAEEEEEQRKRLLEESQKEKVEHADEPDEGDDWEYVEDGPAEIIWRENEIIVKKKRVKVPKRNADQQPNKENDDRPTSNPLPPQSAAFTAFKSTHSVSAQEVLENVAQQIPNFGTEQDKAHCPFHLKTAACRFGSRCSRVHFYPDKSCTLLMKNMYNGPGLIWEQDEGLEYTDEEVEHCYEEFYEDVHTEFLKFGEIVNFKVCRNGSFHLRGNVYVHYKSLESALLAYNSLNGRYFAGKQITCEFVAITRWKAAICGEYMKSRLKTCSHGTACNFIHCFRNPGGDYEWADWDNPPPKHWVKKMAALFGFSLDIEYDKHADMEKRERPSDSSWKRRHKSSRYHSSGSRYGETDIQDSDSGRDASDGTRDRHSRHSSRRRHSHKRRKDMYSPDKPGNSEGNYYTGAHHTNGNHTSRDHESNEYYFGGEELDDKLKFKQRENCHEHDRYGRKRRRGESSNHAREKVPVDERDKSSVHKSQYHEKHSKRKHGSSDWDSGRDYSDDNSDQSNCHSSERTPYEYDYHTHDDLKYKEKNDFGDCERLDRKFKRADSSKQTKGRVFLEEQRETENKRKSQGSRNRRNKSLNLDSVRDHGDNEEQSEIHSSEKASKHHVNPHERYTGEVICDDHGSDRKISCENRSHCSGCSDESKALGEYRSRYHTKYMSNDNGHDKKISHRKQFACDESSSGGSDDDRVYCDTEFVEEETHSQFIHNRSSRSHIWTDVRGNKHTGSCFKKDKNHLEMGDGEEIKEENRVAGSGNLESEKGTIGKHSRSRTPLQYSSSSRSERSHHRDHVPHDSLHM